MEKQDNQSFGFEIQVRFASAVAFGFFFYFCGSFKTLRLVADLRAAAEGQLCGGDVHVRQ